MRSLLKYSLIGILNLVIIGCASEKNKDITSVRLDSVGTDNPLFSTQIPISYLSNTPNEYKKEIIPDSSYFGYISLFPFNRLNDLYVREEISTSDLGKLKSRIYFISGYDEGKQFFKIDANQNDSFEDDKVYFFDKKVSLLTEGNPKLVDSLFSPIKINVSKVRDRTLYRDDIFITVFPNANYFTYSNPDKETKLKQQLQLVVEFKDYFFGEFLVDDQQFKVAVSKYNDPSQEVLAFSETTSEFSKKIYSRYKVKDTIKLSDTYFEIDSLHYNPPTLELRALGSIDNVYGFRPGYKTKDYSIQNINGSNASLDQLVTDKKLLLMDFWGTWCAPCKELTPDLVQLHQRFENKLSIVSLAYQEDVEPIEIYTKENGMDWFNAIIKGKPKTRNPEEKIIKELRINIFPTFILLDTDLNIVYRMTPFDGSFNEMADFIKNY